MPEWSVWKTLTSPFHRTVAFEKLADACCASPVAELVAQCPMREAATGLPATAATLILQCYVATFVRYAMWRTLRELGAEGNVLAGETADAWYTIIEHTHQRSAFEALQNSAVPESGAPVPFVSIFQAFHVADNQPWPAALREAESRAELDIRNTLYSGSSADQLRGAVVHALELSVRVFAIKAETRDPYTGKSHAR